MCVRVRMHPFAQALLKCLVQLSESPCCWVAVACSAHLKKCKLAAERKHPDRDRLGVSLGCWGSTFVNDVLQTTAQVGWPLGKKDWHCYSVVSHVKYVLT